MDTNYYWILTIYMIMEDSSYNDISMTTLERCIINAITSIRISKKRPDELHIHDFVKKNLETSVTIQDIINALESLTKSKIIENKPTNNGDSYYLIDSFNKRNSAPPIPKIANTPLPENNTNFETLLNNITDELDSFLSDDGSNDNNSNKNNESSERIIDNAYKNIKYYKLKDVLLTDIKKDIFDFVRNEINEKKQVQSSKKTFKIKWIIKL